MNIKKIKILNREKIHNLHLDYKINCKNNKKESDSEEMDTEIDFIIEEEGSDIIEFVDEEESF